MIILGIGDYGSTSMPEETIKTIGLGSCVAVICTDAQSHIAGMLHVALPDSSLSPRHGIGKPGYFADTGLPALFDSLEQVGWRSGTGTLAVKLAGGAAIMDPHGTFNIGTRNVLAIRKILRGMGLGPIAEDVGGNLIRTVSVSADTGAVVVTSPGRSPHNL